MKILPWVICFCLLGCASNQSPKQRSPETTTGSSPALNQESSKNTKEWVVSGKAMANTGTDNLTTEETIEFNSLLVEINQDQTRTGWFRQTLTKGNGKRVTLFKFIANCETRAGTSILSTGYLNGTTKLSTGSLDGSKNQFAEYLPMTSEVFVQVINNICDLDISAQKY